MIEELKEYKGKEYIIREIAEMKDISNRQWTSCVIYEQVGTGRVFVREFSEFYKLFKKVE